MAKFCLKMSLISGVINCCKPITKYRRYQYSVRQANPFVTIQLRNSNKQHLILAKLYVINAPFIGNQSAKFKLNLPKQTVVAAAFVKTSQNTYF